MTSSSNAGPVRRIRRSRRQGPRPSTSKAGGLLATADLVPAEHSATSAAPFSSTELDNGADDTAPTISASGANLYFGSTRAGASGSTLWVATRTCQ